MLNREELRKKITQVLIEDEDRTMTTLAEAIGISCKSLSMFMRDEVASRSNTEIKVARFLARRELNKVN